MQRRVFFFGNGSKGDVETIFDQWLAQFDGGVANAAKRGSFDVRGLRVHGLEIAGTYTIALGPPPGPRKKAPVEMVKSNYRLIGAVVEAPDRGNWFFKLVGPDETVQSARSGLHALLESAR